MGLWSWGTIATNTQYFQSQWCMYVWIWIDHDEDQTNRTKPGSSTVQCSSMCRHTITHLVNALPISKTTGGFSVGWSATISKILSKTIGTENRNIFQCITVWAWEKVQPELISSLLREAIKYYIAKDYDCMPLNCYLLGARYKNQLLAVGIPESLLTFTEFTCMFVN